MFLHIFNKWFYLFWVNHDDRKSCYFTNAIYTLESNRMYSIFIKQWIFNNLIHTQVRWHRLLININDDDHKWQENNQFSTKKIHWQDVQNCHALLFRTDHSQSFNIFPKNCSKLVSTAIPKGLQRNHFTYEGKQKKTVLKKDY